MQYLNTNVPDEYQCSKCNKKGCKLWRSYQSLPVDLMCVDCACTYYEKTYKVAEDGTHEAEYSGTSDQISWHVPAVPAEEFDSDWKVYWGYSAVPEAGVMWWKNLPLRV